MGHIASKYGLTRRFKKIFKSNYDLTCLQIHFALERFITVQERNVFRQYPVESRVFL
jgi:hypothetical protein